MSTMAPEDAFIEQCKDVFSSMDLDKNGRITPYIVGQVMKQYGWNPKPYELVVSISWEIVIPLQMAILIS